MDTKLQEQRRALWISVFVEEHTKPFERGVDASVIAALHADDALAEFDKRFPDRVVDAIQPDAEITNLWGASELRECSEALPPSLTRSGLDCVDPASSGDDVETMRYRYGSFLDSLALLCDRCIVGTIEDMIREGYIPDE